MFQRGVLAVMPFHKYIAKSKHSTQCKNNLKAVACIEGDVLAQPLPRGTSQTLVLLHLQHHRYCFEKPVAPSPVPDAPAQEFNFVSKSLVSRYISSDGFATCTGSCCGELVRCASYNKVIRPRRRRISRQNSCLCHSTNYMPPMRYSKIIKRWLAFIRTSLRNAQTTGDMCTERTDDYYKHKS